MVLGEHERGINLVSRRKQKDICAFREGRVKKRYHFEVPEIVPFVPSCLRLGLTQSTL